MLFWGTSVLAQEASGPESTPTVLVQKVVMRSDARERNFIGVTRAIQATAIVPESDGHIAEIYVASGEYVETGQRLFGLETSSEELAVAAAKVNLGAARRQLERLSILDAKGTISSVQLETATDDLQAAKLELQAAELALSQRLIVAPFSGHLGLIDVSLGAYVTTSTELVELFDRSTLLIDFALPETAIGTTSIGDNILVSSIGSEEKIAAPIIAMSSHVNPTSRTIDLRARIQDPQPGMLPGMSYRVQITLETGTFPALPEVTVLWGSRGAYVWRVDDQRAHRIPITIIRRSNGQVLVDADLKDGDFVVSEGVHKLREGDLISTPVKYSEVNGNPQQEVAIND